VVQGLVADAVTGPLAGVLVEAYDRVLQRAALNDVRVGMDRTDADGRYAIRYTAADGKAAADLTVRALDGRGEVSPLPGSTSRRRRPPPSTSPSAGSPGEGRPSTTS
jgi:hypothetical protein